MSESINLEQVVTARFEEIETLADRLIGLAANRGLRLVTAESCTAGMLAHRLSRAVGAAAVLAGGFVTYTKTTKTQLVGVSPELLAACTAVHADIAEAMARGALERGGADLALEGQPLNKPPATPWFAVGPNRILADGRIHTPSTELAADHLARTIASIRKLGRKVVMMAPVPSGSFDVALCAEREDRRQLTRGATPDCTIDRASSMARQARVREVLQIVQERTGAPILDLGKRLCATFACAARIDGVVLYRDAAHLSAEGSALLGRKFSLSDLVFSEAR